MAGSGTGAGSGAGKGSFSGITIQRGSTANLGVSVQATPKAKVSIPSQNAYGMTVVSLATSEEVAADGGPARMPAAERHGQHEFLCRAAD